ncbi:MAG TPA: trypsin-like peptidase domain-containing protein [Candidatus Saccharimonadales bacterium]|nr:trypsin-like peptidase domain-containing protein [Candidatus Saccharimonadales bacterium]
MDQTQSQGPYMPASLPPRQPHGPDSPRIKFLAMATLLIMSLASGFFGGWLSAKHQGLDSTPTAEKQQVVLKSQGQVISAIAKTVGESVVSVNTTQAAATNLFGFGGGVEQGAGTGIIISSDGLIVTNRHVVPAGTTDVTVTLADGTELDNVTVVGRTNSSDSLDVAFLKINDTKGKKLKAASIGDSSKMEVGDPVVAIGNALGQFQNTVTSGILSGYGRSVTASDGNGASSESLENMFQTDAPINEGNSGGPLVNLDGEVIGINTAVAGGNAENIGFSIPINDVSGLITSVKQSGKLERPFLGVVYIPITNDVAEQYKLDVNRGAYVPPSEVVGSTSVLSDGPAAKAGVKAGDIILKINDDTIDQKHSLSSLINKHKVGDKVTLTIHRDGKDVKIDVALGAAPTS